MATQHKNPKTSANHEDTLRPVKGPMQGQNATEIDPAHSPGHRTINLLAIQVEKFLSKNLP